MSADREVVRKFFRQYSGTAVGATPIQPTLQVEDDESNDAIDRTVERPEDEWAPIIIREAPAKPGEYPERFIDGSQTGEPVLCVRAPRGWPIPMVLSEIGAVALRSVPTGRGGLAFEREFVKVERVLSFVGDPFPWEEVEGFAAALANHAELVLRVALANRPLEKHNPFDYEIMRSQARARAQQEMTTLERLALSQHREVATLVDGPLSRVMGSPDTARALVVGAAKTQSSNHLHEKGWRTLFDLKPGQRTPVYRCESKGTEGGSFPVAMWFLKLAGGPQLAPNWGHIRVEVQWGQFVKKFASDFGFVDRLSRWLIDARCRTDSYARMPVSLDPIVRAEDSLKPLFTPLAVLANRLYRTAGLFRGGEL